MFIIAKNTVKEFIRNRILYTILIVAIAFVFFSIVLSSLALSEEKKIILDFSLGSIEIFWLITTLFLGSYLLYNEIKRNTVLLILSKNPSKSNFIIGKFLGFAFVLLLLFLILSLSFLCVLFLHNIGFDINYFLAIFFSYLKILVLLAFIIFFSIFLSPFIVLLVSSAIYLISHMTWFLKFYITTSDKVSFWGFGEFLVNLIYYVFPNFQDLSLKDYLLSPYLWNYTFFHISSTVVVNLIYICILLFLAIVLFRKREF